MKVLIPALALFVGLVAAQERCDVPSPAIFCNTTEILAFHNADDCTPYHVFLARGSDEPYPGRLGNITNEICSAIGGSDKCSYEDVQYPAKSTAWGTDVWCNSAGIGASSGQAQMAAYSEKCPDSKLILLGFSQGGAVAQDILGGGGGAVFACEQDINPPMDATTAPGSNVIAAVTFGAVVRSRNQNFTVGEGKNYDGQRARTPDQLSSLHAFDDVFLDYCHYGDPMCAVGSDPPNVEEHLNYFVKHNAEVTKWVADMAKASNGQASNRPSKPSVSSSTTSVSAKSAASGTASHSATNLATTTATDVSEASSAQTGVTGAASVLRVTGGYLSALAVAVMVLL